MGIGISDESGMAHHRVRLDGVNPLGGGHAIHALVPAPAVAGVSAVRSMRLGSRPAAAAARLRALFALIGVLALPLTGTAAPAAEPRAIRMGPLELGMRIHEIKAALPGVSWKVVSASVFTGRELQVAAEGALELGGQRMKVEVRDTPYEWNIGLSADFTEASPQACEQAGLAVFSALETGSGPLTAIRDPGETVTFGRASSARFTAFEGRRDPVARQSLARSAVHTLVLSAQIQEPRQELRATASFDAKGARNCRVNIMALGWERKPPMQAVTYDESKTLRRMNIGDRHRLASGVALPEGGVSVSMHCQVSRQSGQVLQCRELGDRPFPAAISNVAGRYAGAMAFDMSGIDRDDPQPVLMDIPVRVSPDDVKPLNFGAAPMLAMSDVVFARTPPAKEVQYAFPMKALRKGVGARAETLCQIQADGSLICLPAAVRQTDGQSDMAPDFARGAARLLPQYHAAPTLKDGGPSAGQVFGMGVSFVVSE